MNHMCSEYDQLKLLIENKRDYLDNLEELQTTVQDHWETYYGKESDDEDNTSSDESKDGKK